MPTTECFSKAEAGRTVGCIDIRIEIVAAGIISGREQVAWQRRAAGDRVKSIIGRTSCQTVAMLERVGRLAIADANVVAGDADRSWG